MRPPVAMPLAAMMIGGAANVVDLPRLLDGAGQLEPARVERARARDHRLGGVRIQVLGVRAVERRRLDRHRAVHEGRQPGDAAGVLEGAEVIDQLLGPADREGRHHERAAPVHRGPDDALELVGDGRGVVQPVAVGRLDEDVVGLADRAPGRGGSAPRSGRCLPRRRDAGEPRPPRARGGSTTSRGCGRRGGTSPGAPAGAGPACRTRRPSPSRRPGRPPPPCRAAARACAWTSRACCGTRPPPPGGGPSPAAGSARGPRSLGSR